MSEVYKRRVNNEFLDDEGKSKRQKEALSEDVSYFDAVYLEFSEGRFSYIKDRMAEYDENSEDEQERMIYRELKEEFDNGVSRLYDEFIRVDHNNHFFKSYGESFFWNTVILSKNKTMLDVISRATKICRSNGLSVEEELVQLSADEIISLLYTRKMPIEDWLNILKEYADVLEEKDRVLQENTPQIKEAFIKTFLDKINSILNNPKTREELERDLEPVRFRMADPLICKPGGYQVANKNMIYLNANCYSGEFDENGRLSEDDFQLVAHEALHVLSSGQVVIHRDISEEYDSDHELPIKIKYESILFNQWAGLNASGPTKSRFEWLNEAMTEILSARMVEGQPSAYLGEIELFEKFLESGKKKIDFNNLINAYFERRGYQAPDTEDANMFWRKFRQDVRDAYPFSPQFLIKLDDVVGEEGAEEGLEFLRASLEPNKESLSKFIEGKPVPPLLKESPDSEL